MIRPDINVRAVCRDYLLRHPGIGGGVDDYTADELEFLAAMEQYRRDNRRPYPAFTEVLAVARALGWTRPPKADPLPPR